MTPNKVSLVGVVFWTLISTSCDPLTQLLSMQPLHVNSIRPSSAFVTTTPVEPITVTFSQPMDVVSAENAFSLSNAETKLHGRFLWRSEQTLEYQPYEPIARPGRYTLQVDIGAEDIYGNSLPEPFEHTFTIGTDRIGPNVVNCIPQEGTTITDLRPLISIKFSERVTESTVWSSFSLSPSVEGFFSFSEQGTVVNYNVTQDLERDTRYTVELSTETADTSGNQLPTPYAVSFQTADIAPPTILSVRSTDSGATLINTDNIFLNNETGITFQKNVEFVVTFSRALSARETDGAITLDGVDTEIKWNADFSEATVSNTAPLIWDDIYELEILDEVFRFLIDNDKSRPLTVSHITYIDDTQATTPHIFPLTIGSTLPFDTSTSAAFDVYIQHSSSTTLIFGAFAKAFSVQATNAAISVELIRIEQNPTSPAPSPPPEADETIFRVIAEIEDDVSRLGVVSVTVADGIVDSNGNSLEKPFSVSVNES